MTLYAKLDVHFPDDPKVVEAGDIAELVYIRCFLRSREFLTDGVIDRRLLGRWLAGVRGPHRTHMERLLQVGLLVTHPLGWQIPEHVWRRWNPLKDEVETIREQEKERKRAYRASKSVPDMSQRDNGGTPTGQVRTTTGVPRLSQARPRQPEPEPEPEPELNPPNPPLNGLRPVPSVHPPTPLRGAS